MAYQKKENPQTIKGGCKSVDREEFIAAVAYVVEGGLEYKKRFKEAAKMCGLSAPTFELRANQFLDAVNYGELPKGFFRGRSDSWGRDGKKK